MDNRAAEEILKEGVDQYWKAREIPGAVVGISFGATRAIVAKGITSVDHPLPVTKQTLFQIGSITKTFTCLTLLHLLERRALSLDLPVSHYLPELRLADETASLQVTARHLLTHTAGWEGDFFIDTGKGSAALPVYVARMGELRQQAPPGLLFSYNNAAFSLAGYVIERLSGMAFEAALQSFVLNPFDLHNVYFDAADILTQRFAVGHIVKDERAQVARPWALQRCSSPAGGIVTTMDDLLTYAEACIGAVEENESPLSAPLVRGMWEPQHWIAPGRQAIGLSWFIDDWCGTQVVSHQGATNGQIASLFLIPGHRFAVAALTNSNRGTSFTTSVTRWALQQFLSVEPSKPAHIELAASALQEYVGLYTRAFADVRISVDWPHLIAEVRYRQGFPARDDSPPPAPAPAKYLPYGQDRFIAEDALGPSNELAFFRNADGHIGLLRALNRIHERAE